MGYKEDGLKNVVILNTIGGVDLKNIGENVFNGALTGNTIASVVLSENIEKIETAAFAHNAITYLVIPNKVFEIGAENLLVMA